MSEDGGFRLVSICGAHVYQRGSRVGFFFWVLFSLYPLCFARYETICVFTRVFYKVVEHLKKKIRQIRGLR